MARREATDVLNRAGKLFETASSGIVDLYGNDPDNRLPGLHTLIVFGRAVTFVIQNLRSIDQAEFDAWYAPWQAEMRADPLMRFFYRLRTELEKEGLADTYTVTYETHAGPVARLHLYNSPTHHLGDEIDDPTAYGLSRLYLAYIRRLLGDAFDRFGPSARSDSTAVSASISSSDAPPQRRATSDSGKPSGNSSRRRRRRRRKA